MYESPITIAIQDYQSSINTELENRVIVTLNQHYNISVDKDDLIRALNYDRSQYYKGYNDAMKDMGDQLIEAEENGLSILEFIRQRW